jgi:diguanylate cyclase (GGDEF)-like protein
MYFPENADQLPEKRVISLKKFLADNETEASLVRMVKLLLQGIVLHSMEGDPADCARFRDRIAQVERRLDEEIPTPELVVLAGSALQALEDYNRRTNTYLRQRSLEFQTMVKMLTATVGAITAAGDTNVRQLQEIEKQVEAATEIEDVRQIKVRLSDCLDGIRRETERQRAETARAAEDLMQGLESAQAAPSAESSAAPDPVTGLPPRKRAEEAFAQACRDEAQAYVLAVVIDRIQILNTRFGYEVGDEIMRYFASFLKSQLSSKDLLFRWTGPTLAGLLFRPNRLERVRDEIGRIMELKYEHTVRTASRTILLPISVRWALFPTMASPRLLTQKIENFITFQSSHD